jgi:magnesium transporter
VYRKGVLESEDFPVADVSEHLERPDTVVWVDLCGPSKEQLHELAGELGLHELAVEDALSIHQRPKLDHYPTHLFLTMHAARLAREAGQLRTTEIDAFIGDRWLITVRKDDGFPLDAVLDRWDRSAGLAVHGVGFLLYGLLDVVIDGYFDAVQSFDDFYDEVSEAIFGERPLELSRQRYWFEMRRALVRFHRLVGPAREALSSLMRRDRALVHEELYPYYQDVYDHVLRVTETTDSLRDLVGTIVETSLTLRDYRLNQIMKKVTGWAAIIAVPTAVTGFYGMNVPYPGFGTTAGFAVSMGLLVVLSIALYVLFRLKDWV